LLVFDKSSDEIWCFCRICSFKPSLSFIPFDRDCRFKVSLSFLGTRFDNGF
jgi:hypothetical protein